MALQNDGKIVIAGDQKNGTRWDWLLARYESDGSLDTTFGSEGVVTTVVSANGGVLALLLFRVMARSSWPGRPRIPCVWRSKRMARYSLVDTLTAAVRKTSLWYGTHPEPI